MSQILVAFRGHERHIRSSDSLETFVQTCGREFGVSSAAVAGFRLPSLPNMVFPVHVVQTLAANEPQAALELICIQDDDGMLDAPALAFHLMGNGTREIEIAWKDLVALHFLKQTSKMNTWNVAQVYDVIVKDANAGRRVSYHGFLNVIRQTIPGKSLPRLVRQCLSRLLINIFTWLAPSDVKSAKDAEVHVVDVLALLALLCGGRKSDKLVEVWNCVCDLEGSSDATLNKRAFWRFSRSLLHPLLFFAADTARMSAISRAEVVDDAALEVACEVFHDSLDKMESFAAFGDYYNRSGKTLLWLELFDSAKWPKPAFFTQFLSEETESKPTTTAADVSTNAVIQIPVGDSTDDSPVISITAADVRSHEGFIAQCRLSELDCAVLLEKAKAAFGIIDLEKKLDAASVDLFIAALVSGLSLPEDAIESLVKVVYALAGLLGAEDAPPAQQEGLIDPWQPNVPLVDVLIATLAFVAGSKTEKLTRAFQLLGSDSDGGISRRQTWRLARAFLCAICIFSGGFWQTLLDSSVSVQEFEELVSKIDTASVEMAASIFVGTQRASEDVVTFDELAQLYNTQLSEGASALSSFESLAWFELLDIRKWTDLDKRSTALNDSVELTINGRAIGHAVEADEESRNAVESKKPVFVYDVIDAPRSCEIRWFPSDATPHLVGHHQSLRLSKRACEFVHFVSRCTQLYAMDTAELLRRLRASPDERWELQDFLTALPDIIPPDAVPQAARVPLSAFFLRLFHALDFDGTATVAVADMALALSVFLDGSKSDKLALAFYLYSKLPESSNPSKAASLRKPEFYRVLRALLACLSTIQEHGAELDVLAATDSNGVHTVRLRTGSQRTRAVESVAQAHCETIFDMLQPSRELTSKRLSAIYNDGGGYEITPYLELLSLRKWLGDPLEAVDRCLRHLSIVYPVSNAAAKPINQPVFQFVLQRGETTKMLDVSLWACNAAHRLARLTGLLQYKPVDVIDMARAASANGVVSRRAFMDLIDFLISKQGSVSLEDEEWASGCLHLLFDCLDVEGAGNVSATELAATLLLFASGRKSDKLAAYWEAFSTDELLYRQDLVKVIKCTLLAVLSITTLVNVAEGVEGDNESAKRAIEQFRQSIKEDAEIVHRLAEDAAFSVSKDAMISYQQFADWYNARTGNETGGIPWLELLDLDKWPRSEDFLDNDVDADNASEDDGLVYQFAIAARGNETVQVNITKSDISRIANVVALAEASQVDCADIFLAIGSNTDEDDYMYERGWRAACMTLFPIMTSTTQQRAQLADELLSFFQLYDFEGSGRVVPMHIALGLSLLSVGSKSHKLSFAWKLFGESQRDQPSRVNADDLRAILFSILLAVTHFSRLGRSVTAPLVQQVVVEACTAFAAAVFTQIQDTKDGITFEQFSEWYNGNSKIAGHHIMPFIELLDLRKWLGVVSANSETTSQKSSAENETIFGFLLTYEGDIMKVTKRDILAYRFFIDATALDQVEPTILFQNFINAADDNGCITKEQVLGIVDSLTKDKATDHSFNSGDALALTRDVMSYLFDLFNQKGNVNALEIATALSIMTKGSKSQKLLLAFRMYAQYRGSGDADKRALNEGLLSELLRAMLLGILTFAHAESEDDNDRDDSLWHTADRCALEIAHMVCGDESDAAVTFEEFAEFYNSVGYQSAGFFELLNPARWVIPAENTTSNLKEEGAAKSTAAVRESSNSQQNGGVKEAKNADAFQLPLPSSAEDFAYDVSIALTIRREDFEHIREVLDITRLHEVSVVELYAAAEQFMPDDVASKAQFNKLVRNFIETQPTDPRKRAVVSFALSSLFYALDATNSSTVPAFDALAALSPLFHGGIAEKLVLAWNAFDIDQDERLSVAEFVKMVSALLTGILALRAPDAALEEFEDSTLAQEDDPRLTYVDDALVRALATDMAINVFGSDPDDRFTAITFKEFIEAATSAKAGHMFDWLQLLALDSSSRDAETPVEQRDIVFDLGDEQTLEFSVEDATNMLLIAQTTGLSSMRLSEVYQRLLSQFPDDGSTIHTINEAIFESAIKGWCLTAPSRTPLPQHDDTYTELLRLFYALELIYNRQGLGVPVESLVLGLLPLCAGSKSDKFTEVFQLLGTDNSLTLDQVEAVFRCILASLLVLRSADHIQSESNTTSFSQLVSISKRVSSSIAAFFGNDKQDISFSDFSDWYNGAGLRDFAFIELLSLAKLASLLSENFQTTAQNPTATASAQTNGSSKLSPDALLTQNDLSRAMEFLESAGCRGLHADAFIEWLNLKKETVTAADLQQLTQKGEFGAQFVAAVLQTLQSHQIPCTAAAVSAACLVFCGGDKSSKLSAAWKLFNASNATTPKEHLTRTQLQQLLFSLLTGVLCLSEAFRESSFDDAGWWASVAAAAADAVDASDSDSDSNADSDSDADAGNAGKRRISFSEFGGWYNRKGFQRIPWVELVNIDKWKEVLRPTE